MTPYPRVLQSILSAHLEKQKMEVLGLHLSAIEGEEYNYISVGIMPYCKEVP